MKRLLLLLPPLIVGCSFSSVQPEPPPEPEKVYVHVPEKKPLGYNHMCASIFLDSNERVKVQMEVENIQWDTIECRKAALEELKERNDDAES